MYSCNSREEILVEKISNRIKDKRKELEGSIGEEFKLLLQLLHRHSNRKYKIKLILEEIE